MKILIENGCNSCFCDQAELNKSTLLRTLENDNISKGTCRN